MTFLVPLAGLAAGIVIGGYFEYTFAGIFLVIAALLYYFIISGFRSPFKSFSNYQRHKIWIALLFAGTGMLAEGFSRPITPDKEIVDKCFQFTGAVQESVSSNNGDKLTVELRHIVDSGGNVYKFAKTYALVYTEGFSAVTGDVVSVQSPLTAIIDNPNRRATGYAERMRKRGIMYRAFAEEGKIARTGFERTLRSTAAGWRDHLTATLEHSGLGRPTINFLSAMIMGDRSLMTDDTRTTFSNAGVAHMLAVSGMHIAIIMAMILILLFPLRLVGLWSLALWMSIILIWVYAYFTGLAPSTVRACLMASLVAAALALNRKQVSGNALMVAAFIVLICNPPAVYDPGLQLSFVCVASILAFAGILNPVDHHSNPKLYAITSAVIVSLVATLATWVLTSYYFQNIPLLFLPVNILILPMLPGYMWIAFLYIGFRLSGYESPALAWFLDNGYKIFENTAEYMSGFGTATISYQVQLPVVILWLTGIMIIAFAIRRKHKKTGMIAGGAFLASAIVMIPLTDARVPDGVIVQRNFNDISMALYDGPHEEIKNLPRDAVSTLVHKGVEIIALDCAAKLDSISPMLQKRKAKNRILVLGSGIKHMKLREIPGVANFDKIILHTSLHENKVDHLIEEADSLKLTNIYAINRDGPYNIIKENKGIFEHFLRLD